MKMNIFTDTAIYTTIFTLHDKINDDENDENDDYDQRSYFFFQS